MASLSCYKYENEAEQERHSKAIQMLTREMGLPEEEIRRLYEDILCKINDGARIKEYLVVLVSRNVKDLIRRRTFRNKDG